MKSKTLSSSFTIFKKDITRFSPLWLLWCGMYLFIGYLFASTKTDITAGSFPNMFTYANLIYGICCAVILFGYLSDPRECIMLHSLPIRREKLFLIHLLAGLTIQIVPTALFCLSMSPFSGGNVFAIFVLMVMQFVFFFGLGIFCVMLTGRKFAAVMFYGLINVAAPLTLFAVNTLYIPLLPGIEIRSNPFMQFCPAASMTYRDCAHFEIWSFDSGMSAYFIHIGIFTAIGVVLMLGALVLYRHRKLEYAENFLALPYLRFLFVPICTIFTACFFTIFSFAFLGNSYWFMLGLGGVLGYFGTMMLLHHSPRVFYPKSLGGFALIAVLLAGSISLVKLDPLHRITYVPEADDVARVELYRYESNEDCYFTEDQEQIKKLLYLHQELIDAQSINMANRDEPIDDKTDHVELLYHMDNGSEIKRVYDAPGRLLPQIYWYMSQPECVFGTDDFETIKKQIHGAAISVQGNKTADGTDEKYYPLNKTEGENLARVVFDDSGAGNLYREPDSNWRYVFRDETHYNITFTIHVESDQGTYTNYLYICVPDSATNVRAWITQYLSEQEN